jgi:hypothetical protein
MVLVIKTVAREHQAPILSLLRGQSISPSIKLIVKPVLGGVLSGIVRSIASRLQKGKALYAIRIACNQGLAAIIQVDIEAEILPSDLAVEILTGSRCHGHGGQDQKEACSH